MEACDELLGKLKDVSAITVSHGKKEGLSLT